MLKTSSVVPSPDRQKSKNCARAPMAPNGSAIKAWPSGQIMATPMITRRGALCKAGRVGVLDQVHNTPHPAPEGAFRAEPRTTRLGVSGRGRFNGICGLSQFIIRRSVQRRSFPPPALRECGDRGRACRLVAVRWRAILVIVESER